MANLQNVDRLRPLLTGYIQKVNEIRKEMERINSVFIQPIGAASTEQISATRRIAAIEFQGLNFYFNNLMSPLNQLGREVSQILEHSDIDPISAMENRVLLADLQASIWRTNQFLGEAQRIVKL